MRRRKDLQKIIQHYQSVDQVVVLIEEMSELTKALTKALRGASNKGDIAEEIADVQIMLDQAKLIFKFNKEMMDAFIDYKIDRTLERIKNDNNGISGEQDERLPDEEEEAELQSGLAAAETAGSSAEGGE